MPVDKNHEEHGETMATGHELKMEILSLKYYL